MTKHSDLEQQRKATGTRTLVVYDSPAGSTREIAEFIGETLSHGGDQVTVMSVDGFVDLDHYDRVIVGGAIRYDRWVSGAAGFVQYHERSLSTMPVAYFFTSLAMSAGTEQSARKGDAYARKLLELAPTVSPTSIGRFAGKLDYSKLKGAPRLLLRGMMKVVGVAEGDYRDWDAIRAWTEEVAGATALRVKRAA